MNYLVLAIGGLMTAAGLILLATGFPVIEIERGWATVIAGATLISGGVVTVALGLLLRAVSALRVAFAREAANARELAKAATPPSAAQLVSPAPEREPAAPPLVASELQEPLEVAPRPEPHEFETADHISYVEEDAHSTNVKGVPDFDETHAANAVEAPEPIESQLPASPSPPDWFSNDFQHESGDVAAQAPTEPLLPHEGLPVSPEEMEPVMAPTPAPDVAPRSAAGDTVIGRYEADGTSYVMYADGSIEAQSPAGVYRFASMAELKSFIEG